MGLIQPSEDVITFLIQSDNQRQVQEVNVETKFLIGNSLFSGMLLFSSSKQSISFPLEYSNVAMIYINFINGNYTNKITCNILKDIEDNNLLCDASKLCHYVGDIRFLEFLVYYMQGDISPIDDKTVVISEIPFRSSCLTTWLTYDSIVNNLHDDLQWDIYIYLLSPFTFISISYQSNQSFVKNWTKKNIPTDFCVRKPVKNSRLTNHMFESSCVHYILLFSTMMTVLIFLESAVDTQHIQNMERT